MPSSPNYVRDYKQELKTSKARGEGADRSARNKARRTAVKLGMIAPGSKADVDHKKPLSQGGGNNAANLRVASPHDNRSFPRTKSGAMKKGGNK